MTDSMHRGIFQSGWQEVGNDRLANLQFFVALSIL